MAQKKSITADNWPDRAINRLVADLKKAHTNANVIKFPRYSKQYKGGIRV